MTETPTASVTPKRRRGLLRTILMLDDTSHSIALGTAIGMWVGLTPTVGVQMLIVLAISFATRKLFHFNRVAGVLTVYITNPFTALPVYWFNYRVGTLFVAGTVTYEDFAAIVEYHGFAEWWQTVVNLFVGVGTPLIAGSLIVATVCSVPTYFVIRLLVEKVKHEDRCVAEGTGRHE